MKIILLPGLGKENKEWVREIALLLRPIAHSIQVHHYNHWYTDESFNWNRELKKLLDSNIKENDAIVIGKAEGAALALKAIKDKGIMPRACIFVSVPMKWAESEGIALERWLEANAVPSLFIHNKNDNASSYKELEKLSLKRKMPLISLKGKASAYPALAVAPLVEEFIKGALENRE